MASTVHLVCLSLLATQLAASNAAIWPFSLWSKQSENPTQFAEWDLTSLPSDTSVLFVQPDQSESSPSSGDSQQVPPQSSQVPRQDTFYTQPVPAGPVKPVQYVRQVRPVSGSKPGYLVYPPQGSSYASPPWVYVTPVDEIGSSNQPLIVAGGHSNPYAQAYPGYTTGSTKGGTKGGIKHPQAPIKQPPSKRPWWLVRQRPRPSVNPSYYGWPYPAGSYPYPYPGSYPVVSVTRQPAPSTTPSPPVKGQRPVQEQEQEQEQVGVPVREWTWPYPGHITGSNYPSSDSGFEVAPSESNNVPNTVKPDSSPVVSHRQPQVNVTQSTSSSSSSGASRQHDYFTSGLATSQNTYVHQTSSQSEVPSTHNTTTVSHYHTSPQITTYLSSSDFSIPSTSNSNSNVNLRG